MAKSVVTEIRNNISSLGGLPREGEELPREGEEEEEEEEEEEGEEEEERGEGGEKEEEERWLMLQVPLPTFSAAEICSWHHSKTLPRFPCFDADHLGICCRMASQQSRAERRTTGAV